MRKSTIGDRVALGGLPLVASLLAVIPNMGPIELGFGVRSMFDMELESNMLLPVCVAFEPLLLDDGALESKRLTGGDLNVCLLGNILVDVEALPGFNSVLGIPDILSFDGGGVDVLSIEGGELKYNEASPRDSVPFRDCKFDDPKVQLLLCGTLFLLEESAGGEVGTPSSFLTSSIPVSRLSFAVVPPVPLVRAADVPAVVFSTRMIGCVKGFTAHVCVLNSRSLFLLLVSGSR